MISTLTFIDSLSEKGTPDGMICLRQVAIDIANELFPEPTFKKCRTAEETAIAIAAAKFSRREAEQAHLTELRSWVAQGRIEGKSGMINARVTEGPFIYITKSDRDLYLQSVGLKSKVQSESTSTKSHRAANIEMNFPSMSTKPLIHADTFLETLIASRLSDDESIYEEILIEEKRKDIEDAISTGQLTSRDSFGDELREIPHRRLLDHFGKVFFEREEWSNFVLKKWSVRIVPNNTVVEHAILMEKLSAEIPTRCAVQLPDGEWLPVGVVVNSVLSALYPMPDSKDADARLSDAVNYQRENKLERVVSGLNDAVSDGRINAIGVEHDGKSYVTDDDRVKAIKPVELDGNEKYDLQYGAHHATVYVSSKLKRDDVVKYLRASGYEVAGEPIITTDEVTGAKCDAATGEFGNTTSDAPEHGKVNSTDGLSTSDLAFCFADCVNGKGEDELKKMLGRVSQTKWLQAALITKGTRGKGYKESQWNPVIFGISLINHRGVSSRTIRARFQTKRQLEKHLDAWKTCEAENFQDT